MSEPTPPAIQAAIDRKRTAQYEHDAFIELNDDFDGNQQWSISRQEGWDDTLLANAYLAHIAATEAAEAERALPYGDVEWLKSVGFSIRPRVWWIGEVWCEHLSIGDRNRAVDLYRTEGGSEWTMWVRWHRNVCAEVAEWISTRGQLLDLLSALGLEAKKGGA